MKQINANGLSTLHLGRHGENLARQVVFDVSDWETEYGAGNVELIAQRPGGEAPYPVAIKREDTSVLWDLTSADTAVAGSYGHCELRYSVGDVLVKSRIWRTWVDPAMGTPSETAPPEPEQGWVDQVMAVGAAAKASAEAAKADADRAAELAAQVAEKAAQTAQDATESAQAKEAAQTAQRLAEDAQRAAETAKQAAEAAQSAAAQSANDAATAKQGAETAMQVAQEAAAAAAKALADIRSLYQQMQDFAADVIHTVNAAADSAGQSATSAAESAKAASEAKDAAETAQQGAETARDRAETAAIKQPYPNAETGTWWVWDADKAAYVDSGEPYEGAALYATFDVDPATGKLSVFTPARYHGPTFSLNEATGKLEVTVNG